jgi:hypothetical protein
MQCMHASFVYFCSSLNFQGLLVKQQSETFYELVVKYL